MSATTTAGAPGRDRRAINQKLRQAIEDEGRLARIEGAWWQFSLTERTAREPSAVSLLKVSRGRDGALELTGRAWQEDGTLSSRYWSEAVKEKRDPSGIFYYWKGERPLDPNAPQLHGTGEIWLESADRATGYFTTLSDTEPRRRTRGRSASIGARSRMDLGILDGSDESKRVALLSERLKDWKSVSNA